MANQPGFARPQLSFCRRYSAGHCKVNSYSATVSSFREPQSSAIRVRCEQHVSYAYGRRFSGASDKRFIYLTLQGPVLYSVTSFR